MGDNEFLRGFMQLDIDKSTAVPGRTLRQYIAKPQRVLGPLFKPSAAPAVAETPADANCRLPLREVVTAGGASVLDRDSQLWPARAEPEAALAALGAARQGALGVARRGARCAARPGARGVDRGDARIVADVPGFARAHAVRHPIRPGEQVRRTIRSSAR